MRVDLGLGGALALLGGIVTCGKRNHDFLDGWEWQL
jgi:hypothetical protein